MSLTGKIRKLTNTAKFTTRDKNKAVQNNVKNSAKNLSNKIDRMKNKR